MGRGRRAAGRLEPLGYHQAKARWHLAGVELPALGRPIRSLSGSLGAQQPIGAGGALLTARAFEDLG